jgi:hypothetical protein
VCLILKGLLRWSLAYQNDKTNEQSISPRERARRPGQVTINPELESSVGPRGYFVAMS